jgi:hypothetical protein
MFMEIKMSNKSLVNHLIKDHGYDTWGGRDIDTIKTRKSAENIRNHSIQHQEKADVNHRPLRHNHQGLVK